MKTRLFLILLLCYLSNLSKTFSQSVSINTTGNAADTSAILDITSASKGLLIPRMTYAQRNLIFSPADGLLIYQTDAGKGFYFFSSVTNNWNLLAGSIGLTSLNGLTASSQTFAVPGTSGTAPQWTSSGSTHTLNIPLASTANVTAGLLSNSDYSNFNNKAGSITLNTSGVIYPATNTFTITSGGSATGTLSLNTQASNSFLAGPTSGATNAQPSFRGIVPADLPVATSTTVGAVSIGSGLSVNTAGVLSATNTNGGTVTSASVVTANGLAGTVANATTTPAVTLSTTVTGMVKGNGTSFTSATSGTDYAPGTSANTTGIVKSTNGTGALTTAVAADFPILNQNTTGTAANITGVLNATSHPALTGDVTSTAGSVGTTISNGVVTNSKLATMPANTFKANNTGSTATPSDITGTQATALLDAFTSTTKGLVPASGGGTANFLRADGTFAVPSGTNAGTVTSVSVTSANGISGTVATPTTTPAISLTLGAITPTSVAATGTLTGSNLSGSHSGISSGTNTGDETTTTIKTKLGVASSTTDGYLTLTDWNTFNNKANTSNVISSLNGLVASTQTFATGTTGSDFNISSPAAGSVHIFNLPDAAANARGVVTTGAQTIAGNKTLSGNTSIGGTLAVTGTSIFTGAITASTLASGASTDSIVTANASGVLRRRSLSDLNSGYWSTSGNTINNSGINYLGTTNNSSLRMRSNNIQGLMIDSLGSVGIGISPTFTIGTYHEKFLVDAGTTTSYNPMVVQGSIDTFFQFNIQNLSSGAHASSDVVATSNGGTQTTNFMDMGINGGSNNSNFFGNANDGYLYNASQNLYIGTAAAKDVAFLTGGGTQSSGATLNNERMRISGTTGYVGIGTSSPTTALQVSATSNPLSLLGVQQGTNTSTDSVLTITNGIVQKIPSSTYQVAGSSIPTANVIKAANVSITDATNINQNTSKTITVSVTGATLYGAVIVSPRSILPNTIGIGYAYVSAADKVSINFISTGNNAQLGTVSFDITVIK